MNQEHNYTKPSMGRDCHNCNNLDGSPAACKLSTKDTQTCKEHPSRPFWRPKVQVTKDEWVERFNLSLSKDSTNNNIDSTNFLNDPYTSLAQVLDHAHAQASQGKGKERHANDNNYEDQVICVVGRLLKDHPFGAHAYQVIKKTIEAGRLYKIKGPEAAYNEMLGAINYAAAMNILIIEKD